MKVKPGKDTAEEIAVVNEVGSAEGTAPEIRIPPGCKPLTTVRLDFLESVTGEIAGEQEGQDRDLPSDPDVPSHQSSTHPGGLPLHYACLPGPMGTLRSRKRYTFQGGELPREPADVLRQQQQVRFARMGAIGGMRGGTKDGVGVRLYQ